MGGFLRRNELHAFVPQSARVNPIEQSRSPAQQNRRDSEVPLIDEARTKVLLDRARSAANAHIHSVLKPRAAKSSSTPLVPPSAPNRDGGVKRWHTNQVTTLAEYEMLYIS